jgi:hypothetical protein
MKKREKVSSYHVPGVLEPERIDDAGEPLVASSRNRGFTARSKQA